MPKQVVVQKLARVMRTIVKETGEHYEGDLFMLYVDRSGEFTPRAKQVVQQAYDMRAVVILFDGIDEASDLKEQVENFVVKVLAPKHIRVVVTCVPSRQGELTTAQPSATTPTVHFWPLLSREPSQTFPLFLRACLSWAGRARRAFEPLCTALGGW